MGHVVSQLRLDAGNADDCGQRSLGTYLLSSHEQVGTAGLMRQVLTVTLTEIQDEVDQVVGRWRAQTSTEQHNDCPISTIS